MPCPVHFWESSVSCSGKLEAEAGAADAFAAGQCLGQDQGSEDEMNLGVRKTSSLPSHLASHPPIHKVCARVFGCLMLENT